MDMETFKYGDKVTHQLHGTGKVHNVYPDQNLVQVFFEGNPQQVLVHPVSLTKLAVPMFEARIEFTEGAVMLSGPMEEAHIKGWLTQLPGWAGIDSYTVTRIKSSAERTADYLKGMAEEDDALADSE